MGTSAHSSGPGSVQHRSDARFAPLAHGGRAATLVDMAEHRHLEADTIGGRRSSATQERDPAKERYDEARPLLERAHGLQGPPAASRHIAPASLVHPSLVDHRAPRGWWQLDLSDFPCSHHTSMVFERLDCLAPDGHLLLACPYPPDTLRAQIEAWCPDEFRWTWITAGPVVWRAQITRRR